MPVPVEVYVLEVDHHPQPIDIQDLHKHLHVIDYHIHVWSKRAHYLSLFRRPGMRQIRWSIDYITQRMQCVHIDPSTVPEGICAGFTVSPYSLEHPKYRLESIRTVESPEDIQPVTHNTQQEKKEDYYNESCTNIDFFDHRFLPHLPSRRRPRCTSVPATCRLLHLYFPTDP